MRAYPFLGAAALIAAICIGGYTAASRTPDGAGALLEQAGPEAACTGSLFFEGDGTVCGVYAGVTGLDTGDWLPFDATAAALFDRETMPAEIAACLPSDLSGCRYMLEVRHTGGADPGGVWDAYGRGLLAGLYDPETGTLVLVEQG